jgi:cation transport regulator ChaC
VRGDVVALRCDAVSADLWVFGYGSLVWRPAFPFVDRVAGHVGGYVRRFWQGSPDHRGTPDRPGRVVTLSAESGARCEGVAFRVAPGEREAVLENLDERESGGFGRVVVPFHFAEGAHSVDVLVYIAAAGNPNYLGPASTDSMVAQMRDAVGKSGRNIDYVLHLAESLESLAIDDPHVTELAGRLSRGTS